MACVIVIEGFASGVPCPIAGQYLKSFDFEADGGHGYGEFTLDIDKAMQFNSVHEAMEFYRTQPKSRPIDQGRPNRPLTASSVSIMKV